MRPSPPPLTACSDDKLPAPLRRDAIGLEDYVQATLILASDKSRASPGCEPTAAVDPCPVTRRSTDGYTTISLQAAMLTLTMVMERLEW